MFLYGSIFGHCMQFQNLIFLFFVILHRLNETLYQGLKLSDLNPLILF